MLAGKIKYLLYLCVRHIILINSSRGAALIVNRKHDLEGGLMVLIGHALQNVNYELNDSMGV